MRRNLIKRQHSKLSKTEGRASDGRRSGTPAQPPGRVPGQDRRRKCCLVRIIFALPGKQELGAEPVESSFFLGSGFYQQ